MNRPRTLFAVCAAMTILCSAVVAAHAQSLVREFPFTEGTPRALALDGEELLVGAGGTTVYMVSDAGVSVGSFSVASEANGLARLGADLLVTKTDGADAYTLPDGTPTSGGVNVPNTPNPSALAYDPATDLYYLAENNGVRVTNLFGSTIGACTLPSTFDTVTGLTTTSVSGEMLAVGAQGLYRMQTSSSGNCNFSTPTPFAGFTDAQAIAHVSGSGNIWVAFGNGTIAEFSNNLQLSGLSGKTTITLDPNEPGELLVMDWTTTETTGVIGAGDLTNLSFTWTKDGVTRFQDDAIVDSVVQPIGDVERKLEDVRFNFDIATEMLVDGAGSDTAWDNDYFSVQSNQAVGETARFEGALIPTPRALISVLENGQVTSTMDFPRFTQSTELQPNVAIPEPTTLVAGLLDLLAMAAARRRR